MFHQYISISAINWPRFMYHLLRKVKTIKNSITMFGVFCVKFVKLFQKFQFYLNSIDHTEPNMKCIL